MSEQNREKMKESDTSPEIEVVTYSGYKSDERPLKIVIGSVAMEVTGVIDRWYGENFDYFKIHVDTGTEYLIARHRIQDRWYLKGMNARISHH